MRSLASAAVDGGATAASAAAFARPHACAPRPRCLARRPRDGGAFGGRRPPPAFVSREVLSRGCGSVRCSSVAAPTASSSILPRPSPPLGLLLAVAAVCASAALAVLSPPSLLASAWHSPAAATAKLFLAGSLCACLSHAGATPVDVLKTRMQTEPGRYKGLADAAWRVTAAEGPAALLRGLGPTAAGYATHGACRAAAGGGNSLPPSFFPPLLRLVESSSRTRSTRL